MKVVIKYYVACNLANRCTYLSECKNPLPKIICSTAASNKWVINIYYSAQCCCYVRLDSTLLVRFCLLIPSLVLTRQSPEAYIERVVI